MTSSCLLSPGRPKQGIIVWLLAWVEKLLADGRKHSFYMRLRGTPCFCQLTGHSSRPCRFPIGNGSGCAHPCPAEMLRIKPGQSLQGTTWTLAASHPRTWLCWRVSPAWMAWSKMVSGLGVLSSLWTRGNSERKAFLSRLCDSRKPDGVSAQTS